MSRHPDSGGVGVNYRPGIPRYLQIADAIRQDLRGEGERIPSEHALCKRFKVSPPTIPQALRLPPRSSVYQISGVRHADNGPFQHVTAYVPLTIGTALSDEDLSKTSLIGAIERVLGVPIKLMEQVVDAALAPRQIAELLQVRSRSPLLLFERTYFAASGEPVEYAITYQTGRRYPYRIVLSRAERRS